MMDKKELNQVVNIINKHIKALGYSINENDILNTPGNLVYLQSDIFEEIFSTKSLSQKNVLRTFFHYKTFDLAYDFIHDEYITLSALSNFHGSTDDLKEYQHFYDTIDIGTAQNNNNLKNDFFVFCLSEDNYTDKFWEEYAKSKSGLCIEFKITSTKDNNLNSQYELRKICYDDGVDFSFFKEVQKEIRRTNIKQGVFANGISKFGAFYKRKSNFDWERETRLFFNNTLYGGEYKRRGLLIQTKKKGKYLKINLKNDYFHMHIESIKTGENITLDNLRKIKELTKRKNIKLIS